MSSSDKPPPSTSESEEAYPSDPSASDAPTAEKSNQSPSATPTKSNTTGGDSSSTQQTPNIEDEPTTMSSPAPTSAATGSIVGSRTPSGTLSVLGASGTFEESSSSLVASLAGEEAAGEANPPAQQQGGGGGAPTSALPSWLREDDDGREKEVTFKADPSSAPAAAGTTTAPTTASPSAAMAKPTLEPSTSTDSEEDDEIRRAKAMALAIQANPNLTPEEIRSMVVPDDEQKKFVEEAAKHHKQHGPQHPAWLQALTESITFDQHHQHQGVGGGGGGDNEESRSRSDSIGTGAASASDGGGVATAAAAPAPAPSQGDGGKKPPKKGVKMNQMKSLFQERFEKTRDKLLKSAVPFPIATSGDKHGGDGRDEPLTSTEVDQRAEDAARAISPAPTSEPAFVSPTISPSTGGRSSSAPNSRSRSKSPKRGRGLSPKRSPLLRSLGSSGSGSNNKKQQVATAVAPPPLVPSGEQQQSTRKEDAEKVVEVTPAAGATPDSATATAAPSAAPSAQQQPPGVAVAVTAPQPPQQQPPTTTSAAATAVPSSSAPHVKPKLTTTTSAPTMSQQTQAKVKTTSYPSAPPPQTKSFVSAKSDSALTEEEEPQQEGGASVGGSSGANPIILSGVAWKRRSGLGKHYKHAWERRKIVLRGTKLYYFKSEGLGEEKGTGVDAEGGDTDSERQQQQKSAASTSSFPSSNNAQDPQQQQPAASRKSRFSLWEQAVEAAKDNFNQLANQAATATNAAVTGSMMEPSDPNAPRGSLDVVKERAAISATMGHSGAPTPFALSFKVKSETKWKLCFDSHRDQMEWLAALTDIVVKNSVEEYNAEGERLEGSSSSSDRGVVGQISDGAVFARVIPPVPHPPNPFSKEDPREKYKLEKYTISSSRLVSFQEDEEEEEDDDEEEEEEEEEEEDEVEDDLLPDLEPESVLTVSPPDILWSLKGQNLKGILLLVNGSLFLCRASSTSMELFWYVVTFLNLAVWNCVVRENGNNPGDMDDDDLLPTEIIEQEGGVEVVDTTTKSRSNLASSSRRGSPTKQSSLKKQKSSKKVKSRGLDLSSTGKGGADKSASVRQKKTRKSKSIFKPIAGTSTVRLEHPDDEPVNANGDHFAAWRVVPGSALKVRSHGYLTTKKKVPSPGELYDCVQVDIFESAGRVPNIASRVVLPKVNFNDDDDNPKNWHSPDVFVVSFALPTKAPKLRGGGDDGEGYTVTMYYTMKAETRAILRRVTSPHYDPNSDPELVGDNVDKQKQIINGVRLWDEWCRRAPTDPKFQARFKLVPNAHNLTEIGMPKWIGQYNGKPCLIKRADVTGFIYPHPNINALEFDISLHPFPYLFKSAMSYMKDNMFKKLLITVGFVIEGRADDELPEVVIGSSQICYPNPAYGIRAEDFFGGRCPKSFELTSSSGGDSETATKEGVTKDKGKGTEVVEGGGEVKGHRR